MHLCYYLFNILCFCIHSVNDIHFIKTGKRNKTVEVPDAFFKKKVVFCCICANDRSFRKKFGKFFTSLLVLFNNFYVDPHIDKLVRKIISYHRTADYHYAFNRAFEASYCLEEIVDILRGSGYVDFITFTKDKIASGNCNIFSPSYSADKNFYLIFSIDIFKRKVAERTFFSYGIFNKFNVAAAEKFNIVC